MLYEDQRIEIHKQDQALVIDFLSRCAEVLLKHGAITEKLTYDFRFFIRDSQLLEDLASQGLSLLTRLMSRQSEFMLALCGRFGDMALFTNLLRYSIENPLSQLVTDLNQLGQELIKKSQLNFNRPIYVYRNQTCEAQILASSVLIEISEELADAAQALQSLQAKISIVAASQLHFRRDQDEDIDHALAEALGLAKVGVDILGFCRENQVLSEIKHIMTRMSSLIGQALDQIRKNNQEQSVLPILSRLDRLRAEAYKLDALPMNPDDDLILWDSRRLLWLESLAQLHVHLLGLGKELKQIFRGPGFHHAQEEAIFPASMQRRLFGDMIATGLNPREASVASSALLSYCRQNNLRPSRLVPAELRKIHPLLSEQSLKLLQEMDIDRSLATQSSQEKKRILDRSERLMAIFRANIGTLAVLLAFMTVMGCGLKTDPQSQLEDFRPAIPYQTQPTLGPEVEKEAASPPGHETAPAAQLEDDRESK